MAIILAIIGIVVVSCIYETLFKSGSVNDIKKSNSRDLFKKVEPNRNTAKKTLLESYDNIPKKEDNPSFSKVNVLSKDSLSNTGERLEKPLAEKESKDLNIEELLSLIQSLSNKKHVFFDEFESNDLSCYFLHDYYPLKYTDISEDKKENRKIIYDFKNGVLNEKTMNIPKEIATILLNNFSKDLLKEMIFICLPSSTELKYKRRYANFSNEICKYCGMINFFQHVSYLWDRKAKHIERISAGSELSHIHFPKEIVKDKNVIIFDDVFTTGKTLHNMESKLKLNGANVVAAIFVGKTYDQYRIKKSMLRKNYSLIED